MRKYTGYHVHVGVYGGLHASAGSGWFGGALRPMACVGKLALAACILFVFCERSIVVDCHLKADALLCCVLVWGGGTDREKEARKSKARHTYERGRQKKRRGVQGT